jgi:hypothetical protein
MKVNDLLNERDSSLSDLISREKLKITDPDAYAHQEKMRQQDREHDLNIGSEGRAELKAKADELAEIKRQQLRKEALEDAELAFQRAETRAQREAEMEKIKRQFQHDLDMINTQHKHNMEAIRTGNAHEINKMDKEHQQEKDMFDRQSKEKDKDRDADQREKDLDRQERERERQQNKPKPQSPDGAFKMPEPEPDEPKDQEFQDFKADLFKLSGLPLPAPAQQPEKVPSKFDNSDAVDIDFKEVPKKDDEEDKGNAPMLPGPKKEDISKFRDIVDKFEKPQEPKKNIPTLQKKFEVGQTVKFGLWQRPQEHRVGKVVKVDGHKITVDVGGKPVEVHLGNKSLVINPVEDEQQS